MWDGKKDAGSSFLLLEVLQVRSGGGDVFVCQDAWHFDRDVFESFGTVKQDGVAVDPRPVNAMWSASVASQLVPVRVV